MRLHSLKMEKKELRQKNRREKSRLNYAKKVQDDPEFYKQEKIRIREYNRNRYANDPEFAEKIKANLRETYKLKQVKLLTV